MYTFYKQSNEYIKEFDGLRALAVIAVMFQHYLSQHHFFQLFGASGVTLFFVLSGFLITQILLKEKNELAIDYSNNRSKIGQVLKTFYIRRSLRIFPIYYITLALLVLFNIDSARPYFTFYFFYISNFLGPFYGKFDRLVHFWSLSVEEQFYLVWPLLILFLPLKINRIKFFGILIVASLVLKIWVSWHYSAFAGAYLMPCCIEAFAFGALTVELIDKKINKYLLFVLLSFSFFVFIVLQLLPVAVISPVAVLISQIFSRIFFSAISSVLIILIVQQVNIGILRKILLYKPLMYLGKISYGIYLYHMFVPGTMKYLAQRFKFDLSGSGFNLISHFLITFAVAHLSFVLIEKPINRLKTNFLYK